MDSHMAYALPSVARSRARNLRNRVVHQQFPVPEHRPQAAVRRVDLALAVGQAVDSVGSTSRTAGRALTFFDAVVGDRVLKESPCRRRSPRRGGLDREAERVAGDVLVGVASDPETTLFEGEPLASSPDRIASARAKVIESP